MININELEKQLKEKEITLCELYNKFMYYSLYYVYNCVYDEISTEEILEDESISYWLDDNKCIKIVFEVVSINEEELINSVIKVKCVEEL